MGVTIFHRIIWFFALVLMQALIFNNIHLLGYATPFIYIYFLLKLNSSTSRNALLLWGFAIGLCVDIFSNTPGMNAAATVLLALMRPFYLQLFTPRDTQDILEPSSRSMGLSSFLKYLFISVLTHHIVLFCIMFFSFADIITLTLKIVFSTILTVIFILAFEGVRK